MTDFPRFDRDSLYNYVWDVVGRRIGYGIDCDVFTDQICDAVTEWVPKKGDYWLNKDDGMLYVNRGWKIVSKEAIE